MPTVAITDPEDERIRDFVALKGRRDPAGVLIAESELVVRRLLAGRLRVRALLVTPARRARMVDVLDDRDDPVFVVEPDVMAAIAGYDVHRGVLASADRPALHDIGELAARSRRLVVLEGSNDTENLGAVARSARALGVDGLVIDPTCADPWSRRSVRVSMGEVLDLPVARCEDLAVGLDELHRAGFETWALTPAQAADVLFDLAAPGRVAVVVGAEGPGLAATTMARCSRRVRIPMHHGVDSLNLGHAVAVAVAHVAPGRSLPT